MPLAKRFWIPVETLTREPADTIQSGDLQGKAEERGKTLAQLRQVGRSAVSLKSRLVLIDFEEDEFIGFLGHAMTQINQHARLILLDSRTEFLEGRDRLGFFVDVELKLGDLRNHFVAVGVGRRCDPTETERRQAGACRTKRSA